MKPGIFTRSTAGYLVVLFLLGASNVYAILKLVQFNTYILDSQNVEIHLLDTEKKLVDSIFSQRRYEQKYILTRDAVLYNQFRAAKEDFDIHLASINSASLNPPQNESVENVKKHYQRYQSLVNVIDLTNRFITRAEAPLLDAVLPWIFSARPDGFDGRDEQAVQFF